MPARLIALAALVCHAAATASAGVAVIVNHTDAPQTIRVSDQAGLSSSVPIAAGYARPLFSDSPLVATVSTPDGARSTPLVDGAAYRIVDVSPAGAVRLSRIGFDEEPGDAAPWRTVAEPPVGPGRRTLRVVVYVDEDERTREEVWKRRLRRRIEKASEVFRAHAGVGLKVVGFGRWESDDRIRDFVQSFGEFQRVATPPPGHIALGFSSQYVVERGSRKLGGTRGMLRRHLMIREWSPQVTESDRLELLLHELGHHFGAAHSPEPGSLMRPLLGDRRSRLRETPLRYDVASTLVMALVGDEVRSRGVSDPNELTSRTRNRLAQIYAAMREAFPQDPAAGVQARRVGKALADPLPAGSGSLRALTAAAIENRKRPLTNTDDERKRLRGEELTNHLVRTAARAAAAADESPADFLLTLGVAFDPSGALGKHPRTRPRVAELERPADAKRRANVLGEPTARGREDTLKHFTVMAALVAQTGAAEASAIGFAKEAIDAQGGTGFSFADIAANRAGARFAERVLSGATPLDWIAEQFRVNDFVPKLDDLPEGMQAEAMIERFGGRGDPRFESVIAEIDRRIEALPPYRPLKLDLGPLGGGLRKTAVD